MYLIEEMDLMPMREDEYLLVNYLSGAADVVNAEIASLLEKKNIEELPTEVKEELVNRKYIFDDKLSKDKFENDLVERLNNIEEHHLPNFLIIPTYCCNLQCTYCFEGKYDIMDLPAADEDYKTQVDNVFNAINRIVTEFEEHIGAKANKNEICITLMGGEPLLYKNYHIISYIVSKINEGGFRFNVITNGVDLNNFVDLFKTPNFDFAQVTIDGPKKIHDSRRIARNKQGTYDTIVNNIKLALEAGLNIFIRVNIDLVNMDYLPELADEILANFGTPDNLYPYIYLIQDGGCSGDKNVLDELACIKKLIELEKEYPQVKMFHKRFHGQDFIEDILSNRTPCLKLRNCAACKEQYILDFRGDIYRCWWGVGNKNFRVGTYDEELHLNYKLSNDWKKRTSIFLTKCSSCKYRYICGGGCTSHIIKSTNDVFKEHCADFKSVIKELLTYGYLNQ